MKNTIESKYCPHCNTYTKHELEIKRIENQVVTYNDECRGTGHTRPHVEEKITTYYQWQMWVNNNFKTGKNDNASI